MKWNKKTMNFSLKNYQKIKRWKDKRQIHQIICSLWEKQKDNEHFSQKLSKDKKQIHQIICSLWITFERNGRYIHLQQCIIYCIVVNEYFKEQWKNCIKIWKNKNKSHQIICSLWEKQKDNELSFKGIWLKSNMIIQFSLKKYCSLWILSREIKRQSILNSYNFILFDGN